MPILQNADGVASTSATTGTGTYALGSAVTGYRAWSAAGIASGSLAGYNASEGANWEVGYGTLTSGSPWTLTRGAIVASSNGGGAVNWSGAGPRTVASVALSQDIVHPVNKRRILNTSYSGTIALPSATWADVMQVTLIDGTRRFTVNGGAETFNNSGANNGVRFQLALRNIGDTADATTWTQGTGFNINGQQLTAPFAFGDELAAGTSSSQIMRLRTRKVGAGSAFDLYEASMTVDCTVE